MPEKRDFTRVSDAVAANLQVQESNRGRREAFNVGSGELPSIIRLVPVLVERLGKYTYEAINAILVKHVC